MALVVHAANFGLRPKGAFQNNVERKLTNGLIRNGHQVLNFSDRDAAMAGSLQTEPRMFDSTCEARSCADMPEACAEASNSDLLSPQLAVTTTRVPTAATLVKITFVFIWMGSNCAILACSARAFSQILRRAS